MSIGLKDELIYLSSPIPIDVLVLYPTLVRWIKFLVAIRSFLIRGNLLIEVVN